MLRKWLEWIGSIRIPPIGTRNQVRVGSPNHWDALHGTGWREFANSERLFDVWGPLPGSTWEPFHCATLFAALDRIPAATLGPGDPQDTWEDVPHFDDGPPAWLDRDADDTWVIVDLPGPKSVAVATWLCSSARFQPVCTFDNWPNPKGILLPERNLGALLHFAPVMDRARQWLPPTSAPLWVCDRQRLGTAPGKPGQFDNRYFLDDSLLPGPQLLQRGGIRRVVYLCPGGSEAEVADLSAYFEELNRTGFELLAARLTGREGTAEPVPLVPVKRKLNQGSFFRSSAGGFGAPVPEPSSSSG